MDRADLGVIIGVIGLLMYACTEHQRWQEKQHQDEMNEAQDELNAAFVVQIAGVQERMTLVERTPLGKGDGDFPVYIYHIKGRG